MASLAVGLCLSGVLLGPVSASVHGPTTQEASDPKSASTRPNILLVILDDIAYSELARIEMPTVDFLRSAGVEFTNGHANPQCSPTRRSILTGEWIGRTSGSSCEPGDPELMIPEAVETCADLVRSQGYATALFGKWHLGSNVQRPAAETPLVHGFDHFLAGWYANLVSCDGGDYFNWDRIDDGVISATSQYHTEAVTQSTLGWIEAQSEPWFAWVAYQAVHTPIHVPPDSFFPSGEKSLVSTRDRYEAMVRSLDHAVGLLLAGVDLRETLVIVVGDNGTAPLAACAEQDRGKMKFTTYRDGIHVPFFMAGWNLPQGVERDALVHTADIAATVAAAAGADWERALARTSSANLLPVARAAGLSPHEYVYCAIDVERKRKDRAIVTATHKLREVAPRRKGGEPEQLLYDRIADPNEESPLDLKDPDLQPLLAQLRGWLAEH